MHFQLKNPNPHSKTAVSKFLLSEMFLFVKLQKRLSRVQPDMLGAK